MKREKNKNFRNDVKNNFYMIGLAYHAYPVRVIGNFIATLLRYGVLYILVNIVFLEKIVGYIEEGVSFEKAALVIGIMFLILVVSYIFFINYYDAVIAPAGNQILYEKLHLKMFEKATDVELACFEDPKFYNKYTKATSQIKGKAFAVLNTMSDMLTILFNLTYLTYKAVTTDVFILVLVVFPIISTYISGVKMNKTQFERYENNVENDRTKEYVKRTVYLRDYAKEIRLSNIYDVMMDKFEHAVAGTIRNIKKYGVRLVALNALQSGFSYSFTIGFTICYAALRLLYWKNISAADFVVLVSVINGFIWNVVDVAKNLTKIQDNSQYIQNIKSFMEYEPKISESQDGKVPVPHEMALRMNHIGYTYLGQSTPVLKDICLDIEPGQKIALVGHNGAGKTTLVKLLMRLYDATEGEITLGGSDIREYAVRAYRDRFATVFQDYRVLSLTVAENVMMGEARESDRETVIQALQNSGVYDKVQTLKKGLDTTLTKEFDKEGAVLSGGETQKIAIARVFAKDCDFVILDEPSSALDPIAEYQMYDSMLSACKDKAVIFISHRLSSAVLADHIYMLEDGRIIEHGSHQKLMEQNGKYAQMFQMQAASYR